MTETMTTTNDLYQTWLETQTEFRGWYDQQSEWDAQTWETYRELNAKREAAWFDYVASAKGVTVEQAASEENAKIHSARD